MKEFIITSRGVKNKVIDKINDSRLTSTMDRTRSGATQTLREKLNSKGEVYRAFMSNDSTDVISIEHGDKHVYAELIDGEWYWVNGCCECNGEKRCSVNSYIECVEHDICRTCKTPADSHMVKTRWGGARGWQCNICHDTEKKEHLEYMMSNAREYSEWEFSGLENIECPYCNEKREEWWEFIDQGREDQEVECFTCEKKYYVTPQTQTTFDIIKKYIGEFKVKHD